MLFKYWSNSIRLSHQFTPSEQLPIIQNAKPGVVLIRGAAGSGKTSTAILRIKQLAGFWLSRRERSGNLAPVRMLVITFNRTLKGYIEDLATSQLVGKKGLELKVETFAKWSQSLRPSYHLIDDETMSVKVSALCSGHLLDQDFLKNEVDYILGRFKADNLEEYLTCTREGRGTLPKVTRAIRTSILEKIVSPYQTWKKSLKKGDWHDLSQEIVSGEVANAYDIIIADEAQDLSANQVRAIMHYAANPSSVTFVLDAAQRIYPRGFTWREAGVSIQPNDSYRLTRNHRNTIEICQFASPLLNGLDIGDDGTFPDFSSCSRHGPRPVVIKGLYSKQVAYAIKYIREKVDLTKESVAFLKPKGGVWFKTLTDKLRQISLGHIDLTRRADWPKTSENIAICTMNSAKGLEFDHVIMLGLNSEVTPHNSDPEDHALHNLRRLLAMASTRARESIILGYKPSEASGLIQYLDRSTYNEVEL